MSGTVPGRARSTDDLLGVGAYARPDLPRDVRRASAVVGCYNGGDTQNGHEFAEDHIGKLIYVPEWKLWLEFNGLRWAPCNPLEFIQSWASRRIYDHPEARIMRKLDRKERGKAFKARVDLWESIRLQKAALEAASAHPGIRKHAHELDTNPWLLGTRNAVVDLRNCGFPLDPEPGQFITKAAGTHYDSDAQSDLWDSFLDTAIPNPEMRAFVQRCVGYSLAGVVDEERLFMVHGPGASGKSTFANVIEAALGEYSVTASKDLLVRTRHASEAERQVIRLMGARMVSINETASGDVFDDQLVKRITSREAIPARRLYGEAFAFEPTHTAWLRGNYLPGVYDAGSGFWRRLVPIEFANVIPPEKRIPDLDRRLIEEALPAVLAWAVEGCVEWQESGLRIPRSVEVATDAYRESTDLFGQWLSECTKRDPSHKTKTADLFDSYSCFANASGASPGYVRTFADELARRGFKRDANRAHGRRFVGLRLINSAGFSDE